MDDIKKEFDYILEFAEATDFAAFVALKQLRALWTAFCLHHDLDPDTGIYDCYLLELWNYLEENVTNPFAGLDYGRYDLFMGGQLC